MCMKPPREGAAQVLTKGGAQGARGAKEIHKYPLEEEMATHSSILAWRIPWREEPGGQEPDRLQSMGSQRVRHN